jgi:exosortase A-associated hydrolase 2
MREAFFLDGEQGRIFCLRNRDQQVAPRSAALLLPPFGDEMNKSRHVLTQLVNVLGCTGHDVIMPDLYGTGDSEGDFGDASISAWHQDIENVMGLFSSEVPLHVIGLRFGALLATDIASDKPRIVALTLIHPIIDGAQQLTQLLRLRTAGNLSASRDKETLQGLRQRLVEGESLEIAGYSISSRLATQLADLRLRDYRPAEDIRVNWLEIAAGQGQALAPAGGKLYQRWEAEGARVTARVLSCPQFWATQEIAQCPELVSMVSGLVRDFNG